MTARRRLATLTALAVLVAGCGWGGGGTAGAPSAGGKPAGLTAAGTYSVESLDPHGPAGASAGTQLAAQAIFSRLVRPGADGSVTGDLATRWTSGDGATTWTFTLREGVTFSDGSPLTAQDVVASFDRVRELKGPVAGNFPDTEVSAPSDREVVFTSRTPNAAILGKLTQFYVVPAKAGDGFFGAPVGSGPFTVTSFTPGESLELAPNRRHWNGAPTLGRLTVKNIPELSARLTALRTGEVQVVWGIPDDQLPPLKSDPSVTVQAVPGTAVFTMWFNSRTPALKDAAVRRALWQAVDFKKIISSLYPETGTPADSVVAPTVLGHAPQPPVPHDPDGARAALAAAGFDFAKPLRLQFSGAEFRQFVQAVASDLDAIGVKTDVREKEPAVFLEDLLALKWDVNFQQLATPTRDAATNLGRLYPCAAGRNGYCNEDLDALLAKAEATDDTAERERFYAGAIAITWNDAVGMYPMFVKVPYAWRQGVNGLVLDPSGLPDFSKVTVNPS
ncbi:ABC transporter substrate-binding protein [Microtetraspora sp. NBRC 13810]|uniref:ABC transporter substrate-binding protein n=1 Tax=Microtetraspora sp. NBRC 13810 TaxID=3030990 RepID=UPI0024A5DA3A|nr:ABC transporter substrate-binding protein [Microtetraspora sp. NBRC 13810]GLW11710.1 ABC transporter substrate-binding protein [Microtetraspora sp. NBRC 13810]